MVCANDLRDKRANAYLSLRPNNGCLLLLLCLLHLCSSMQASIVNLGTVMLIIVNACSAFRSHRELQTVFIVVAISLLSADWGRVHHSRGL